MAQANGSGDARSRAIALSIGVVGIALAGYVELALTTGSGDRFGWFVYEASAWLALLCLGPFVPVGTTVLVGAAVALGLEAFAYWRVFGLAHADDATIYLWKPLAQIALIAGAWFGGYLTYQRTLRERAHG
jgi:hypothetical protein